MPLNIPIFGISLSTKSAISSIYCVVDSPARLHMDFVSRNSRILLTETCASIVNIWSAYIYIDSILPSYTYSHARASNFCVVCRLWSESERVFHLCLLKQHRSSAIRFEGKKTRKTFHLRFFPTPVLVLVFCRTFSLTLSHSIPKTAFFIF